MARKLKEEEQSSRRDAPEPGGIIDFANALAEVYRQRYGFYPWEAEGETEEIIEKVPRKPRRRLIIIKL